MSGKVVKIVLVICPDKFGLHKDAVDGVYVRYALLLREEGIAAWLDDPLYEDVKNIIYDTGIEGTILHAQCQWCQAKEAASESS